MNATLYCNQCGNPNPAGAQFCSRCGTALVPVVTPAAVTPSAPASMPAALAAPASSPIGVSIPAASYAPVAPYAAAGPYGGFWIRVVAAIIDSIVINIVAVPLVLIILAMGGAATALGGFSREALPILVILLIVPIILVGNWLYEALMESSGRQATVGKIVCGLKVTDFSGNRISFGRATGRHFAKMASGMGFALAGFTERKQALHDMLAGTLVRRS